MRAARIDDATWGELERWAGEHGMTRSEAVRWAIAGLIGRTDADPAARPLAVSRQ